MMHRRGGVTPGLNPVARGDLNARLGSPRGLRAQMVYLVICSAFLLLSLPPEIGRLELRDANLLLAFLVVQIVAVTYLSSAIASSELGIEGEKSLPDLTLSAFSAGVIAGGKAQSSAIYAAYLLGVTLPLMVLAATLRGSRMDPIVSAGILTFVVATAAGIWGAWLSGRFTSDFTRSFIHWAGLAGLFGGAAALPAPWSWLSPIRAIDEMLRTGWSIALLMSIGTYALAAAVGVWLIRSHVHSLRVHEVP